MENSTRTIEMVPLRLLTDSTNPHNPKRHDVEMIDASVARFGFVEPIVMDERTGMLISGHGRTSVLAAMNERGDDPPEGVIIGDDEDWLIPVIRGWSSEDDNEANAVLVALNRATELGGWDETELLGILTALDRENDLAGVGFAASEVDDLQRYVDSLDLALNYDPVTPLPDPNENETAPDDLIMDIPIRDGQAEVVVVFDEERSEDLHKLLHDIDYVIDVRRRIKRRASLASSWRSSPVGDRDWSNAPPDPASFPALWSTAGSPISSG